MQRRPDRGVVEGRSPGLPHLRARLRRGDHEGNEGPPLDPPRGEAWVEVQSVRAGDGSPLVGIRTFVPASEDALSAGPILDPAAGIEIAVSTARSQAAGALTPDALVEIVDRVGPDVTNAFLIERGEPFGLDRASLAALAARGVPGEVVDVMVAVSYPERFQVAAGEEVAEVSPETRTGGPAAAAGAWPRRRWFRGYSPWGLGYDPYWDPYFSSSYWLRYGAYGYGGYGYGGYGYGYGPFGYGGLGGGYRAPSLVVIQPPTVTDRGHAEPEPGSGPKRPGATGPGPSGRDSGLSRSPGSSGSAARAAPRPSRGSSPARAAPSSSRSPAGGGGGSGKRPPGASALEAGGAADRPPAARATAGARWTGEGRARS